jgi:hypothetical protein
MDGVDWSGAQPRLRVLGTTTWQTWMHRNTWLCVGEASRRDEADSAICLSIHLSEEGKAVIAVTISSAAFNTFRSSSAPW